MDLLNCPFCGGEAKEEEKRGSFGGYGFKRVYCQKCTANAKKEDWQKRVILNE